MARRLASEGGHGAGIVDQQVQHPHPARHGVSKSISSFQDKGTHGISKDHEDAFESFCKALMKNSMLKSLDLSWNAIGQRGTLAVTEVTSGARALADIDFDHAVCFDVSLKFRKKTCGPRGNPRQNILVGLVPEGASQVTSDKLRVIRYECQLRVTSYE